MVDSPFPSSQDPSPTNRSSGSPPSSTPSSTPSSGGAPTPIQVRPKQPRPFRWLERAMVVVVALNVGLVFFDLSYVPWRNFWLQHTLRLEDWVSLRLPLPNLTRWYDPYKGIEPHRETEAYLAKAAETEQALRREVRSPQAQLLLVEMRELSDQLVDTNPFEGAGKSGTFEKIKNRLRDRLKVTSSKQAFQQFWSVDHLEQHGVDSELNFFNRELRPLIETNYYRRIGEDGGPLNRFWRLDLPFQILFALDLLVRTVATRRRYPSLSWREAALWRWYDLVLLLPGWRWLRLLPLTLRLQQAQWLDLSTVRDQFSRGFVALFAGELMEVMVVQTINQVQTALLQGNVIRGLLRTNRTPYIGVNDVNEVEAIARKVAQIIVYSVLPQIRPQLEGWINYNLQQNLRRLPLYEAAQRLPGLMSLPNQLTQQLISGMTQAVTSVSQQTYTALAPTDSDPQLNALTEQLSQGFINALADALQDEDTLNEIRSLISDFLEEFKLNYVQRLSQADFDTVLEETQQLVRKT